MTAHTPFTAFAGPTGAQGPLRTAITAACRRPEPDCVPPLIAAATVPEHLHAAIRGTAIDLVGRLRSAHRPGAVQALVHEYALSTPEGVALMCLAEALLRIPDTATRDALIRDKIAGGDWRGHLGLDRPLFVNAASWGLLLTGQLAQADEAESLGGTLTRLLARAGEPVIRRAMDAAMRAMGEQFVCGETIKEALRRAAPREARGFAFSYDMLGEAALTAQDAARYLADYEAAIHAIGAASAGRGPIAGPGISIKLSALHPRYSRAQAVRVRSELLVRVADLCRLAKRYDIGLNIDAEETDRLEISLDLLEALAFDPSLAGWNGLGFVVQAYQKRCPFVIDWIIDLARRSGRRIMVRLVKGAYWDAEIKRAQVDGLPGYPVYTRKPYTDVSYIACARKLLAARDAVFPQFATHNAQSVASVLHLARPDFTPGDWEFQCLHGMGEALYDEVVGPDKLDRPCRVYAPVGTHETLLAYLVRRLLENGANSSFVNRIHDPAVPIEALAADPAMECEQIEPTGAAHPLIPLPADLYPGRANSPGLDLASETVLSDLCQSFSTGLQSISTGSQPLLNPANHGDIVGFVTPVSETETREAASAVAEASPDWAGLPVEKRAEILERAADLMQARLPDLLGPIMREAGKTAANAIAEVREAIDFLRYYAQQARETLAGATPLGVVTCISPWNFPLAIFTGQVAAALAAGNAVLAKPAEETPLIAQTAVAILHEAGVPHNALRLVIGDGRIGAALVAACETGGVLFTGSTEVARSIQQSLAMRRDAQGRPIPLVAETGGQNVMIVDSSALPEQVVADVLASAFDSAGQRCSALRVLCLQEDIAERTLAMLRGAMAELVVGNPDRLSTDIGPVISAEARDGIEAHVAAMAAKGHAVWRLPLSQETAQGTFVAPTLIEIDSLADLSREVFGPVLHVLRYRPRDLDALLQSVNETGYGLTFGLHTRLDETVRRVCSVVEAGNHYVNRNMVGAVVGVQAFGGRGLSGTGPKAGGPLYLTRLAHGARWNGPLGETPQTLRTFAEWLKAQGLATLADEALALPTRLGVVVDLPGPVGETNRYSLHPRGTLALQARTAEGLWRQVSAALATGNAALVMPGSPVSTRPAGLPTDLPVTWSSEGLASAPGIAAALVEGDALAAAQALAARDGAVVPLHAETGGRYPLDLLVEERSTSINTTAAGGNASLMAMA
jgi:RHH-type proline utilization regulon transcriptional repressor/proline dehydrogenase/delta 1-pyrroline-5-carboxylate dehydrogenase